MKTFINIKLNKLISIAITSLLIIAIVSPVAYIFLHRNTEIEASAEKLAPQVVTQAINDAEKDIIFDFYSNDFVNLDNFKNYVVVTSIVGVSPEYRFQHGSDNFFEILAPVDGYEEGVTYKIGRGDAILDQLKMLMRAIFYNYKSIAGDSAPPFGTTLHNQKNLYLFSLIQVFCNCFFKY